jgi:hypothetical protein
MSRGTAGKVEIGRFDVRSADGTSLAVRVEGDGPPLVLVRGGGRRCPHGPAGCAVGALLRGRLRHRRHLLTNKVHHLVLYEPGLGITDPAGSIEAIEEAVAAGDKEAATLAVLVGIVETTPEDVDSLRASPRWSALLADPAMVATVIRQFVSS